MSPTSGPGPRPKGLRFSRIAVVALLVTPILEIMVIVAVGQAIGGWWTFALLLAMSLFGAWLIRREGSRAWQALNQAMSDVLDGTTLDQLTFTPTLRGPAPDGEPAAQDDPASADPDGPMYHI